MKAAILASIIVYKLLGFLCPSVITLYELFLLLNQW